MHVIRGGAAEHQLGLCMVAMRTLATMYSNAEWVRNIFQKLGEKRRVISNHPSTTISTPARAENSTPTTGDSSTSFPSQCPQMDTSGNVSRKHYVSNANEQQTMKDASVSNVPAYPTAWREPLQQVVTDPRMTGPPPVDLFPQGSLLDVAGYEDLELTNTWREFLFGSEPPFNNPFVFGPS